MSGCQHPLREGSSLQIFQQIILNNQSFLFIESLPWKWQGIHHNNSSNPWVLLGPSRGPHTPFLMAFSNYILQFYIWYELVHSFTSSQAKDKSCYREAKNTFLPKWNIVWILWKGSPPQTPGGYLWIQHFSHYSHSHTLSPFNADHLTITCTFSLLFDTHSDIVIFYTLTYCIPQITLLSLSYRHTLNLPLKHTPLIFTHSLYLLTLHTPLTFSHTHTLSISL